MPEGFPKKLTDDGVRRILTADSTVTAADLAAELGVSKGSVFGHRQRRTKWSMRIARELGLVTRKGHRPHHVYDEQRAYVVRGKR